MSEEKATVEERVLWLKNTIGYAATIAGLNITIYDGKIGFVDQERRKIVALWSPEYTMQKEEEGKNGV